MPLTSFYTALTGINNNAQAINVIGDNLANMNTTAFKASRTSFSELLAGVSGTSASGNPITAGLGSTVNGVNRVFTQGTITYTGKATDASINGNGFFIVSIGGGMGYTRAGKFEFDKEGNFLSADGFKLLGYPAIGGQIDTTTALEPIQVRKGQSIAGVATQNLSLTANLDAQAPNGETFPASVQVYDSLGTPHTITVTFTKTGAGAWDWSAALPAVDTGGAVNDPPVQVGSGSLGFNNAGRLTSPATNPLISLTGLSSGAADFDIAFNLVDGGGANPYLTNYSSASTVSRTTQDGFAATILREVSINNEGVIIGLTESGQSIPLAMLALADFPNVEGLQKYIGSTFVAFTSSGEPSIGGAGMGGRGSVVGASLEQSNVDMAQEFVNLIVAQRAYQANSKVITTTDVLYQDAINLVR